MPRERFLGADRDGLPAWDVAGLLPKVDYDAWIYYTATLIQTPGGKVVWRHIAVTITPTIREVLDKYVAANPDTPSYIELNPLRKRFRWGRRLQKNAAPRFGCSVGRSQSSRLAAGLLRSRLRRSRCLST